jgi:hypothetical protein
MKALGRKLTFQELRLIHNITIKQIADQAEVSVREVCLIDAGTAVEEALACRVLHAFSLLTGHHFWFEQLDIPLRERSRQDERDDMRQQARAGAQRYR